MQRECRYCIQKTAIVAYEDQCSAIIARIGLELQRRFELEMIGRLVEQQQIGFGKQDRGERDADPPAARQLIDGAALQGAADQVEQGRLASAVAPDQPDFAALGNLRTRAVEQNPPADTVSHAGKGQHARLLPQTRNARR